MTAARKTLTTALVFAALALVALVGIAGLAATAYIAPWWCIPFFAVAGFKFGGAICEMFEAVCRVRLA